MKPLLGDSASRAAVASILVVGAWDEGAGYPRTAGLLDGLARIGVDARQVRVAPPAVGAGGKARLLRSPWAWPSYALAQRRCKRRLQSNLECDLSHGTVDAVLVPYPGHFAVHWVREVLGAGVPIVLDLFLSAYGTVVEDRALFGRRSWAARWLRRLDRRAVEAADLVLLDTPQHAAFVVDLTQSSTAIDWVPITDLDAGATPQSAQASSDDRGSDGEILRVLFFGTGVALHGLRSLCEAVSICDATVHLTLVGGSANERAHARRVVPSDRLTLGGVFEPLDRLRERMRSADLVAGVFGASRKAQLVVPYKVVQALGAGRPVLTGDTEAVRALLRVGRDCAVCPVDDAVAIADELASLARDQARLKTLSENGRHAFDRVFSPAAAADRLATALARVGVDSSSHSAERTTPTLVGTGASKE